MFGINTLKMKKQEVEQENAQLRSALANANKSNSEMDLTIKRLNMLVRQQGFRIEFLEKELNIRSAEDKSKLYSDDSKYY
jgi:hypothetical protein